MRKSILLGAALVVGAMVSCTSHDFITTESNATLLHASVEAFQDGTPGTATPGTRSVIEITEGTPKTAAFKWALGDAIAVYTSTNTFEKFVAEANKGGDSNKMDFAYGSEVTPAVGAIYPYRSDYGVTNVDAGKFVKVTLPAAYGSSTDATPNTNMPMLAYLEGDNLEFKHLCGVALFRISNLPAVAAVASVSAGA